MNLSDRETISKALEIFNLLLAGEEVSKTKNDTLYRDYLIDTEMEEFLNFFVEKLDMEIYRYNDKLYICPNVGNKVFGYTNKDFTNKISYIKKVEDLYLCYFIIMTLLTMFYKESSIDTHQDFIKFFALVCEVTKKFENLIKIEDLEKVSKDNLFNFALIAKTWTKLQDGRENCAGGKNDKVSFIRNVCNFLQEEGLVVIDDDRHSIHITDRFKAIIYKYFEDRENKNKVFDFVNSL